MTRKHLFVWTVCFVFFAVMIALFWRHQFAHTPPSLRDQIVDPDGLGVHIYGESPAKDGMADRALLADAERGNPGAQYVQAMILEQVDMKAALRWYEAAAAQGYEDAIERLRQLREQGGSK
ncbi:sel1 repeat family protein [Achromobacter seleniivolatilans]|uniref:Sel1 repeat family protein n=1 Tax=Achromobacter seleniivolatilans TaxID=3047478 RepID=A0ABY9M2H4_9BURK|nr:sel1 repeat family protein [Achromobacter sp. R39]WMD21194.1 sel1 repeat family protein [Achromobacter sp. R39]